MRNTVSIPAELQDLSHPDALSTIEARILSLYASGMSRAEIARQTDLSPHTVGHYLTIAKDKLHARSLAHAVYLLTASSKSQS